MRKYDYIPKRELRRQYRRRYKIMCVAMTVIPAALWSFGVILLVTAAAMALL